MLPGKEKGFRLVQSEAFCSGYASFYFRLSATATATATVAPTIGLCTYLITQAAIDEAFKLSENLLDNLMRESVLQGIIDSQLIFPIGCFTRHKNLLSCSRIISFHSHSRPIRSMRPDFVYCSVLVQSVERTKSLMLGLIKRWPFHHYCFDDSCG